MRDYMEMWSFLLQKEDKMENIKDMAVYNSRMSAGMEDKLFFLPFLKKSPLLIDYGCADGTLAKYIKDIYPDAVIYGYDICLLYTSPSPRDSTSSRMPSSA